MSVYTLAPSTENILQALVADIAQWPLISLDYPFTHLSDKLWNVLCNVCPGDLSRADTTLIVGALKVCVKLLL